MNRLRITVPLSSDEFIALRESATDSYRHPRDQARFLLRVALGLAATDQQATQAAALPCNNRLPAEVHHA